MCSRFSFVASQEAVEAKFRVTVNTNLRTSYNISATQHAHIITNDSPDRLQYVTWGLIPFWSDTGKNTGRLINARRENISGQTSFRMPIRKRRCLVLADSYYEWMQEGMETTPYRIKHKTDALIAMAGVWDEWSHRDYTQKSFSIITTEANPFLKTINSRMPVLLLDKAAQEKWLNPMELPQVLDMLHPPSSDCLDFYRISKKIEDPTFDQELIHKNLLQ